MNNVGSRRGRAESRKVMAAVVSVVLAAWTLLAGAGAVVAEPGPKPPLPTPPGRDEPPNPTVYPATDLILQAYHRVEPENYFIPGYYGVFFLSPNGQSCGIWVRGNFGCTGFLPGTPPGTSHIGWFNGDTRVHYDWTAGVQFPNVPPQKVLPPRSYINWNESTCAVTADGSTFCRRGEMRFYITPTSTILNG